MEVVLTSVSPDMDPMLQFLVDQRLRGVKTKATSSVQDGEIAVLAHVKNDDAWKGCVEVRDGCFIAMDGDTFLFTGRVLQRHIESLRKDPNILSLKAARPVRPALKATRTDIGLPPTAGSQSQKGKGVVVGIVDYGCDFAHRHFRHADGTTRILALWDQSADTPPDSPVTYGRLFSDADINHALNQKDPYEALGHFPGRGSHGTHVMDIAAGSGPVPGVAPEADIVFVQLAASDIPWDGEEVVGRHFGDSVQVIEAVRFIFDYAGDRPCVVNLSLGTNGGPHDGTSLVELAFDRMVEEQAERCIVIAAANAHDDGIHTSGRITTGGTLDMPFDISAFDTTHTELEVWYDGSDVLDGEVLTPDGTSLGVVPLGQNGRILSDNHETVA